MEAWQQKSLYFYNCHISDMNMYIYMYTPREEVEFNSRSSSSAKLFVGRNKIRFQESPKRWWQLLHSVLPNRCQKISQVLLHQPATNITEVIYSFVHCKTNWMDDRLQKPARKHKEASHWIYILSGIRSIISFFLLLGFLQFPFLFGNKSEGILCTRLSQIGPNEIVSRSAHTALILTWNTYT